MDVSCVALIVPVSIHFPHGPVDQKHTAHFTNKETEAGRGPGWNSGLYYILHVVPTQQRHHHDGP